MSGQKLPEKSSIEKFHQERSDQDVTGRVIKGRKIVVKAKTSPFVTVLSSGQRLVLTYYFISRSSVEFSVKTLLQQSPYKSKFTSTKHFWHFE